MDREGDVALRMGSIHAVLQGEKALRGDGVDVRTRVSPREISADCGMVLVVAGSDLSRARESLERAGLPPLAAWTKRGNAFEPLEDTGGEP